MAKNKKNFTGFLITQVQIPLQFCTIVREKQVWLLWKMLSPVLFFKETWTTHFKCLSSKEIIIVFSRETQLNRTIWIRVVSFFLFGKQRHYFHNNDAFKFLETTLVNTGLKSTLRFKVEPKLTCFTCPW